MFIVSAINRVQHVHRAVVLKLQQGGLCCSKYVDHAFNRANFCLYDKNVLVKPVCVKLFKEGESEYRVVAFFY